MPEGLPVPDGLCSGRFLRSADDCCLVCPAFGAAPRGEALLVSRPGLPDGAPPRLFRRAASPDDERERLVSSDCFAG